MMIIMRVLVSILILMLLSIDCIAQQKLSLREQMLTAFLPNRMIAACSGDQAALHSLIRAANALDISTIRIKWSADRQLLAVSFDDKTFNCEVKNDGE